MLHAAVHPQLTDCKQVEATEAMARGYVRPQRADRNGEQVKCHSVWRCAYTCIDVTNKMHKQDILCSRENWDVVPCVMACLIDVNADNFRGSRCIGLAILRPDNRGWRFWRDSRLITRRGTKTEERTLPERSS